MTSIVCLNGSPRRESRTAVVVAAVAEAIAERLPSERHAIHMAVEGAALMSGQTRDALSPEGDAVCRLVEGANVLVVGSPVYRASYTGLLKHLFDMVDRDALRGSTAVLIATGGSPHHALVIEHQFRPLMSFFGVCCATTAIYALECDIVGGRIVEPGVLRRVVRAAEEITTMSRHTMPSAIARAA